MRFFLAAMVGVLGLACTSTTGTNPDGGGSKQDAAAPAAEKNLTCLAILKCLADCPAADMACPDACADKGSADGKAKVVALAQCVETNKCMDVMCLETSCATQLDACLAPPPQTGGTPLDGSAPMGSIPQKYVGSWQHTSSYGSTDAFVFRADGTLSRKQFMLGNLSGCSSSTAIQSDGTAVFMGDDFTFNITKSDVTTNKCGVFTTVPGSTGAFPFSAAPTQYTDNPIRIFDLANCTYTTQYDREFHCSNTYYPM
jgi:hypothetical protein